MFSSPLTGVARPTSLREGPPGLLKETRKRGDLALCLRRLSGQKRATLRPPRKPSSRPSRRSRGLTPANPTGLAWIRPAFKHVAQRRDLVVIQVELDFAHRHGPTALGSQSRAGHGRALFGGTGLAGTDLVVQLWVRLQLRAIHEHGLGGN
jgi:hypothetical protein